MIHIGFEGRLIKSGSWYAVEIPTLLIFSQAKTQKEGLYRANSGLQELLEASGVDGFNSCLTQWVNRKDLLFMVFLPVTQPVIAFMLRQIRGYKEMSLSDVAKRMGHSSKNSIAAYEKSGGREPTIGKLSEFLQAYGIDAQVKLMA